MLSHKILVILQNPLRKHLYYQIPTNLFFGIRLDAGCSFNEDQRLRERYVRFNAQELMRTAARAVGSDCVHIEKMAEGGFNKIFLLTMDNGNEVIARIPTPIAGTPFYSTASEVATMDFLRTILDLPIPEVLAHSSTADNPVGSEYVIMERIRGESLASRWLTLSTNEIKGVMNQLARMEERLFSYRFPAFGSLYYNEDIPMGIPLTSAERFCIGPIAKRVFWFDERQDLNIDRGPWTQPKDAMTAAASRELTWIRRFATPQRRRTFILPTQELLDPSEHSSLLSQYLLAAPFLVPQDTTVCQPTLRHPDLSLPNIILEPNSSKIISFIDWQDTAILPLFMQAGYPAFCEHELSRPQSIKRPELPDDFDRLSDSEKQKAWIKHRFEEGNLYYTAATGLGNKLHYKTMRLKNIGLLQFLISQTGYPWDADYINLKMSLVYVAKNWDTFSPEHPCPIFFTPEEQQTALCEANDWNESASMLSQMRESMSIDSEGGTEPENFDFAMNMNLEFRMEMVKQAEPHQRNICWQTWPFKDDDDQSPAPPIY
ncbi:hypothetical protein LOZ53_006289 [Ophidiomyces ophidiicola]|uniref:uncharacterized protein n=1 Tax=Ophidiomyces ophidiicola TaxID=1387563 RepID=UPI0020C45C02|nr:uncharacterized protein LOZ57_003150 [Ophidiomyces ophidiicola]KAI1947423.1 hypothetical protein LOZ57_003150 [Ophidiomyces ophidiicola]KAI1981721.1 hypothetical protein LOZ54_005553 [Ophidiomyces ophidiicola]KAI1982196.1 hypothetical protein LOZ53_006289 [Ophidiomyces ophidiicola]KAI2003289.1 hypothetical protein LOZ51_000365 [Ophidiomyces ophidiicola]KAI2045170.1 hypothetical protein LOZ43_006165 [Ophidiomyces ophidiicola]